MARSAALQAMMDKTQSSASYQAQQTAMKEKQFGAKGTAQAATNSANYYANQNTPQQSAPKSSSGSFLDNLPNLFSGGSAAKQSATFNGSNYNDSSGVYLGDGSGGYNQVSHGEALANNPLHAANAGRNKSILDAMNSGDWTQHNNFEAQQAPGHYTQGADGNFAKNKDYYASILEGKVRAMNTAGESERAGYEADIRSFLGDLQNAPGLMPSITGINNNNEYAGMYGVARADNEWFNSAQNNAQVRQDGRYEQNMWYDNAIYRDNPQLLDDVMTMSSNYGSADEQKARQQVNSQYYDQPVQQQQQSNTQQAQYEEMIANQQAEYDAKIAAMEKMLEEQKLKNEYSQGEAIGANKGSTTIAPPSGSTDGEHIFAPSGEGIGYTQSDNAMNDELYKYLDKMWQGGF